MRSRRATPLPWCSTTPGRSRAKTTARRAACGSLRWTKRRRILLLPSRWFPLTNYPTNRYTGTFKVTVPDTYGRGRHGQGGSSDDGPGIGENAQGQASYSVSLQAGGFERDVRGRPAATDAGAGGRLQRLGLHAAGAGQHGERVRHFAIAHHVVFFGCVRTAAASRTRR